MNYAKFVSRLSANRRPSCIRELSKILASSPPEMIPLSGGFPNPDLFPFLSATVEIPNAKPLRIHGPEMKAALQYQPTQGLPDLVRWLTDLQGQLHSPPSPSEVIVTPGSQDGLCKAVEMVMEMGDAVVVEEFIYAGTVAILAPYQPEFIVVKADQDGMIPDSLRKGLEAAKKKPKMLYINPNGSNPTGTILTESRRHEIYQIARQHDLLIFEDDPYYFLQFRPERHPTFLSMDTDGRVVRFDSFSKMLSSGMRLGWVTGPPPLIRQLVLHMQACIVNTSSLSQVLTLELLRHWGMSGLMQHVAQVEAFYKERRDAMQQAAVTHLGELCSWHLPAGGMFFWFKANGIQDTTDMIMKRGISQNVMLVPGSGFCPLPDTTGSPYLRASFSVADPKLFDEAFRRLAALIRQEQQLLLREQRP